MNNIWKYIKPLLALSIPLILTLSIISNFQQCSENRSLKKLINTKEHTVAKADSLISVITNDDSIPVSQFLVNNIPELSGTILSKKIDSLAGQGNLIDKPNPNKAGYYSKTKFTANLVKAKATNENDSVAEYRDNNWYIGFNKKSSEFDAQYSGEQETVLGFNSRYNLGKLNFGKETLNTSKWFNDPRVIIGGSETIYVPEKKSNSDFKLFTNTEYRQGINLTETDAELVDGQTSVYQGIGASYQYKRHGIGLEGNVKVIGSDVLPKQEIKLKYNFYIFK